jgi:DNA mismatch repair protein MutS2
VKDKVVDRHTLRVLEYQKVLDKLAAHTSNRMGREAALALAPTAYPEIVTRRLQETREARGVLNRESGMPLGGIHDIREAAERAAIDFRLTPHELLDVAQTLGAARRLRAYLLKKSEDYPLLAEIAGNLPLLPVIEQRVEESISDNAEVRDSATPELARVRSQLKIVHSRLMDRLNNILGSERYRPYIQEPIITLREGRYCIPVKAENRAQLGGIVHDASASGATVFVEPAAVVDLGNELKELAIKEEQEVARILTRLTEMVGRAADDLRAMIGLLANLDLANAKALLAEEMEAVEPRLNRSGIVRLYHARHPLLTGKVVPIDIEVGDKYTTLIITGPNTGGKTVSLKTVGLLTLMAQSGLQVPAAEDTELAIFEQVFADIGDEQDIQQSLSTFSAHLKNIVRIVSNFGESALVLLDEVGAGTDPAEGAALAKALLNALQKKGARVLATTHYGELKEYAYAHAGVENAAVEFDRETLGPTYRIMLGVPGSSHAFYIAGRLGLPESIVEEARGHLSRREQETGELLQQIEESRRKTYEMERDASAARRDMEAARDDYEQRVRQIADVQRTVRREAEEEARTLLRRASEKAENILDELRRMNRGGRKGPTARQKLADLRRQVAEELRVPEPEPEEPIPAEGFTFRKGDRVRVTTLGMDGTLLEAPGDGFAPVQIGAMRATLPVDTLRPSREKPEEKPRERSSAAEISMRKAVHISPEIILRAMRVDEAAPLLDKYMDDAYAAGLRQARIIHGKGTGALRKFVWDYLKTHPVVASFRLGEEGEGGDGATVVTFKE